MLAMCSELLLDAGMCRPAKRTRITASKTAALGLTIQPKVRKKGETVWNTWMVQGWKENGRWMRKQFAKRTDAERFAALKRIELENSGRTQSLVLSPLSQEQHDEAVEAFRSLGGVYTLKAAVQYFLKHHRPPEFEIRLDKAASLYLQAKERAGLRPRTLKAISGTLGRFVTHTDNVLTHEVTKPLVQSFLMSLRGTDGVTKASKKTWNNTLLELSGFFEWASKTDRSTNRPFTFTNPAEELETFSSRQVREQQAEKPETTDLARVQQLFGVLQRWRSGCMLRYFALAYFAGIRPEELTRMAGREAELINLRTCTITIPANVSKTRQERQITIRPNLKAWLEQAPKPLIPTNFKRLASQVRKHFKLSADEARHSFISYHVADTRSVGDAALQAGNSETIVKRHYLSIHPPEEGKKFFEILPTIKPEKTL